jgi:hypothetical protein
VPRAKKKTTKQQRCVDAYGSLRRLPQNWKPLRLTSSSKHELLLARPFNDLMANKGARLGVVLKSREQAIKEDSTTWESELEMATVLMIVFQILNQTRRSNPPPQASLLLTLLLLS